MEVSSTNPARVFGCYPKKGCLEVGSDADLILVDPEKTFPLTREHIHYPSELDYNLYEGFSSKGWPVCTIPRGELLENGEFKWERRSGRFLKCCMGSGQENGTAQKTPV